MAKHYINNRDLYDCIVKYRETCRGLPSGSELPPIPDYVGKCFMLICKKLATRWNFAGYTYREELELDGIENCTAAFHNFDPDKSTYPFTYFSKVAFNAFRRRIMKERKQTYIKHKNAEHVFVTVDDLFHQAHDSTRSNSQSDGMRRHFEVIEKFEKTLTRKKDKGSVAPERRGAWLTRTSQS